MIKVRIHLKEAREQTPGDCFRFATKNASKGSLVVHGSVLLPGTQKRILHAWIEKKGRVYDWQNKDTHPKGIPIERFYMQTDAEPHKKYTPEEALANAARTRNWGPWD